jgi:hypothetical protein
MGSGPRTGAAAPATRPREHWTAERWTATERAHQARVDALITNHLARAARGEKHPVEDFLFTYYSLRPAQLRRWHPGAGVVLLGGAATPRLAWRDHVPAGDGGTGDGRTGDSGTGDGRTGDGRTGDGRTGDGGTGDGGTGVTLDVAAWLRRRGDSARRVRDLLAATASRPPLLGCFGLHEWAMVYRVPADDVRHAAWPLRLGRAATDAVVETQLMHCTHHDAFRFFTEAARPLNPLQPRREDQVALEQPGCLHATMDLYKWAYTLLPAVPSELVADAFELARDVRSLDMRASPYDLRALGFEPVPVETPSGRARYVEEQRAFAARGAGLRAALLARCAELLDAPPPTPGPRRSGD